MKDYLTYINRIGLRLVLLVFCFLPDYACAGNYNTAKVSLSGVENRLCIKPSKRQQYVSFSDPSISLHKDSIKTKYALNDPRNPDCPCHNYQKLADEEYKKLQMQGVASQKNGRQRTAQRYHGNFPADLNARPDEAEGRGISSDDRLHKKHTKALIKFRHRGKSRRFNKWKWLYSIKQWDIWKRIADPTACYRWN